MECEEELFRFQMEMRRMIGNDLEKEFFDLWDHAIWLNEVYKGEVWLFSAINENIFGLLNIDQEPNYDDHCEQCKNELNIMKFELNDSQNYLSAICSPQKFERIQNGDLAMFDQYCVLIGDIINQPDICFEKMKELNGK